MLLFENKTVKWCFSKKILDDNALTCALFKQNVAKIVDQILVWQNWIWSHSVLISNCSCLFYVVRSYVNVISNAFLSSNSHLFRNLEKWNVQFWIHFVVAYLLHHRFSIIANRQLCYVNSLKFFILGTGRHQKVWTKDFSWNSSRWIKYSNLARFYRSGRYIPRLDCIVLYTMRFSFNFRLFFHGVHLD